jgi:hypothetical protein
MEEQDPAGGGERQVVKLVEDDEIGVGESRLRSIMMIVPAAGL